MAEYDDSIDILINNISKLQDKLQKTITKIASSTETSTSYWSGIQREVRKIYDAIQYQFAQWNYNTLGKEFNSSISNAIKELKTMSYKTTVSITDIKNSHSVSQSLNTLLNDSISNFNLALQNGNKKINQLISSTQQINVREKDINKSIAEGWESEKTTKSVTEKLRDRLLESLGDGKTVKVIDVNGGEINYNPEKYAEMVARTKLREAQTAGIIQTAANVGEDLVQVSPNPGCDLCNEYAGKVFSLSGKDEDFPALDDDPPYHPNCRHSLTIYIKDFQSDKQLQEDIDYTNGVE